MNHYIFKMYTFNKYTKTYVYVFVVFLCVNCDATHETLWLKSFNVKNVLPSSFLFSDLKKKRKILLHVVTICIDIIYYINIWLMIYKWFINWFINLNVPNVGIAAASVLLWLNYLVLQIEILQQQPPTHQWEEQQQTTNMGQRGLKVQKVSC